MATIGGTAVTLLDILKQEDREGKIAPLFNVLKQNNGMFDDMRFTPCNSGDKHETTIVTGLPSGTWASFNEGIQPSKGSTAQVTVQTGYLASVSAVDKRLADRNGNARAVRTRMASMHLEGLSQQITTAMIYEDERTNPKRITGIQAHYASVSTATAASAENVIDGGGTQSDNCSIYLLGWGDNGIVVPYPVGFTAGLKHTDEGEVDVVDATGITAGTYRAYRDRFEFQGGVAVQNWTTSGRICNIDTSNLDAESSNADLVKLMIRLSERVQRGGVTHAWYMNRKARAWLRIQKLTKAAGQITYEMVEGKEVMFFDGIPVRVTDALLNSESRVV